MNEKLREIHDRMPAILDADQFDSWLDTKALPKPRRCLGQYPGAMAICPVSDQVNAVRNDDPNCLAPINRLSCRTLPSAAQ